MADSLQHSLDRVRRPRVQVTYDVDTGNAIQRKELPFVVGVMADLSGQPSEPTAPLKTRKFVPLDRDNFEDVLAKSNARVAMRVNNKLANDNTQLPIELKFRSLEDFEPEQVARQIPVLRELLEMRTQLSDLLGKLEGNDRLEKLLGEVIQNSETAKALASDLGVEGETK